MFKKIDKTNFILLLLNNNNMNNGTKFVDKHILCIDNITWFLTIIVAITIYILGYRAIDNGYDKTIEYTAVIYDTELNLSCYLREIDRCTCKNYTFKQYEDLNNFNIIECNDYFKFIDEKKNRITGSKTVFLVIYSLLGIFFTGIIIRIIVILIIIFCYNSCHRCTYEKQAQEQEQTHEHEQTQEQEQQEGV